MHQLWFFATFAMLCVSLCQTPSAIAQGLPARLLPPAHAQVNGGFQSKRFLLSALGKHGLLTVTIAPDPSRKPRNQVLSVSFLPGCEPDFAMEGKGAWLLLKPTPQMSQYAMSFYLSDASRSIQIVFAGILQEADGTAILDGHIERIENGVVTLREDWNLDEGKCPGSPAPAAP